MTDTTPAPDDPFADHPLLEVMLPVAVLTELDTMARLSDSQRQKVGAEFSQAIASHGDDLLYGGRHCVPTFAALARGLAALAHQPGGVTYGGLHWCVGSNHHGTREQAPCAAELAREAQQPDQTR